MTFYILIFALLWVGLLFSIVKGDVPIFLELVALSVFVSVAGQRFETGNDWVVYRDHYIALQNFGLAGGDDPQFPVFEPLYVFLVWVVGGVCDFQTFLLLVALFNGIVLYRLVRVWRASFLGVFAIYYAWLYLATQMATIRHSLAISFVLLGLMAFINRRKFLAGVFLIVAVGFQVFSLVFLVLFSLFNRDLSLRWAFALLAGGGGGIYAILYGVSSGYLAGMPFAEKILLYRDVATVDHPSAGSVAYIFLNSLFFLWVMRKLEDGVRARVAKWSVFYLLFFQIALWMLPVFWNRIQILSLIIQACVLSNYLILRRSLLVFFGVCALSLSMLLRSLMDPAFISYVPYQSYWVSLFFPVRGDGEERFHEALDANRERIAR